MNEEIKSCHLTQASQTARFRQFGWPVLDGNFLFPHSSGSGLMVFLCDFFHLKELLSQIIQTFFSSYVAFKLTMFRNFLKKIFARPFSSWDFFISTFFTEYFLGPFIYYVMPSEGGRGQLNLLNHNTLLHKLHNKGGGGSQKQEKKAIT